MANSSSITTCEADDCCSDEHHWDPHGNIAIAAISQGSEQHNVPQQQGQNKINSSCILHSKHHRNSAGAIMLERRSRSWNESLGNFSFGQLYPMKVKACSDVVGFVVLTANKPSETNHAVQVPCGWQGDRNYLLHHVNAHSLKTESCYVGQLCKKRGKTRKFFSSSTIHKNTHQSTTFQEDLLWLIHPSSPTFRGDSRKHHSAACMMFRCGHELLNEQGAMKIQMLGTSWWLQCMLAQTRV